jgi:peptidoglycan/xylan/chitin deacetylase (PgdA/CDA1 family)
MYGVAGHVQWRRAVRGPGSTVCLTFDFDALSIWIGSPFGPSGPSGLSRGEFGARVGLPRILKLLDREAVPASFFIPGHTIDSFPAICAQIVQRGHEIGHHGYVHESPANLTVEEERRVLEQGIASIERLTGQPPFGYRSPGWELSNASVGLLMEYGFEYDSSMMADDFRLYRCRLGDVAHLDRAFEFGEEVELIEVPASWSLDDWPQMEFVPSMPGLPGLSAYEKTLAMWTADFEYMLEHVPEGVFVITLHPQVIGRGGRMRILEGLIARMKEESGIAFSRVCDVVREWRKANPLLTAEQRRTT